MATLIEKIHADFLEDLEIGQGRSAKTVENYDRYLRRYYEQQGIEKIEDITGDTVREFRSWLHNRTPQKKAGASLREDASSAGVSLATQNYHLIAIRQLLKYLERREINALSPTKIGLAKLGERDIDVLYPEEIDALLNAVSADNSVTGKRDAAILSLLYSTGMRVSESVKLDRDDIRMDSNELAVRGKGNKVRVVFLSEDAQITLREYLVPRQDMDPALFIRLGPNLADASDLRLTSRSVQRMIKKHATAAGLTKNITPHTLRHSFATDLLSNGADVRQVQQLLGHASITTTQVYTHLTDVHLRDVHAKFHRAGSDKK